MKDLSIIFVNYNVFDDICNAIDSIQKNTAGIDYEIIVVDNYSTDRSVDKLNEVFSDAVYVPLENNYGFGYACNRAMDIAKGKFFLMVNPDITVTGNAVNILFDVISSDESIGAVGPVQTKPGQGIERYYSFFPNLYSRFMQEFGMYTTGPGMKKRFNDFWDDNIKQGKPFKVDWIIGSCLMVRNNIFYEIGGFDEAFFLFEEETEWQLRMSRKGWNRMIVPAAVVIHNHHSSTSKMGNYFTQFHEYRSRIVYSKKHDRGLKRFFRSIILISGLLLRILINGGLFIVTFNEVRLMKIKLFWKLIIMELTPSNVFLNERYNENDFKESFLKTLYYG